MENPQSSLLNQFIIFVMDLFKMTVAAFLKNGHVECHFKHVTVVYN